MPRQSEQLGLTQPRRAAEPGLASPLGSFSSMERCRASARGLEGEQQP